MAYRGVVQADKLAAPEHGLFSVAKVQKHSGSDEHWIGGFYVETDACGLTVQHIPLCKAGEDWVDVFDNSDGARFFKADGFGILETLACDNSVGFRVAEKRAQVIRHLEAVTEFSVEHELYYGEMQAETDDQPDAEDRVLIQVSSSGAYSSAENALAVLEHLFYTNNPGVRATIHVTPLAATLLAASGAVDKVGDQLITVGNGSLVTVNRAMGAAVEVTAAQPMYATGPVHVDLGADELITVSASEMVNPSTNQVVVTAERPAAVYFDGCAPFMVTSAGVTTV